MGKASRAKKEAREARKNADPQVRFENGKCLHCGSHRNGPALWCNDCARKGRQRARVRSWPMFNGSNLTDQQRQILRKEFPKDDRWDWSSLVNGDLSHYES